MVMVAWCSYSQCCLHGEIPKLQNKLSEFVDLSDFLLLMFDRVLLVSAFLCELLA